LVLEENNILDSEMEWVMEDMQKLLKALQQLLTYQEPQNMELGFELLEDEKIETTPQAKVNLDLSENSSENSNTAKSRTRSKNRTKNRTKTRSKIKPIKLNAAQVEQVQEEKSNQSATGVEVVKELVVNLEQIKQEFLASKNQDLVIRSFKVGRKVNAFLVFIKGMADRNIINDFILRPLMMVGNFDADETVVDLNYLAENILSVNGATKKKELEQIITEILKGSTALFMEGEVECLIIESQGFEKRNVEKPTTEMVVVGSQEGFSENLQTNLTLIRKIIKNKNLVTEILPVGKTNHSSCAVVYLDQIVNPKLVKEVKRRINSIEVDFVPSSGILEQLIEDHPLMIFPQIATTERPDRVASLLVEGKVAILVDGTPFANLVPVTFFYMLHTSEDMNMRWYYTSLIRVIRFLGIGIALFFPGIYVAVTMYHHEMIPTELLSAIVKARENIPFPTAVEVLMMELSFELIRESGIRIPGIVGPTLGIVGALILGQAAVAANLVSPILIIIVSITALGNYAIWDDSSVGAVLLDSTVFRS